MAAMDNRLNNAGEMNAAVLHAVNDLRYEKAVIPKREKGEVLLKIRASGICGSDIARVFTKGTYNFPTIPGHEFAGEIAESDNNALTGKKAAVFPMLPCRIRNFVQLCGACEIGEYAQCENYDYYGSRRDGGFAEYITVKEWNLVMIPDGLSFEEAAVCEPAAVALHAVNQAGIKIGDKAVIYGAGPIGMILAQWAKINGAGVVAVADIDPEKINFAAKLGFAEYDGSFKADVVIEGTGASSALENCLKAAGNFGRVVLMGNPLGDMNISQKAYWEILRKQLILAGTWNSSYNGIKNEWQTAIDAMKSGSLDVKPLITHRYDLKDCNAAFEMMRDKKEFYSKVMFCM